MLSTHQKSFSSRPLCILIIALITFLHFTACECDSIIEPGPNQPPQITPPQPPTPQLNITSLTYDPATNLITCIIQNQGKQSISGKLIWQITPTQDTDATIQGAALKDGKYEIASNEAIPIAGSSSKQDFTVEWKAKLTSEFTFQAIYGNVQVATPVGRRAPVSWSRSVWLV
jgi:hypothetical protein